MKQSTLNFNKKKAQKNNKSTKDYLIYINNFHITADKNNNAMDLEGEN